jgi:hypothetical protein
MIIRVYGFEGHYGDSGWLEVLRLFWGIVDGAVCWIVRLYIMISITTPTPAILKCKRRTPLVDDPEVNRQNKAMDKDSKEAVTQVECGWTLWGHEPFNTQPAHSV